MQKGKESMVLKLSKALYGLRQAPRAWNVRLDKSLKKLGFVKCASEAAVYKRGGGKGAVILGVYVDDLIVTGENPGEIDLLKKQITSKFDMRLGAIVLLPWDRSGTTERSYHNQTV